MVMYTIYFTKQAEKDKTLIKQAGLETKVRLLLSILRNEPYAPPYEKLVGNLEGYFSRRITLQHRMVYEVLEEEKAIKILRMWTHYDHI